MRVQVRDNGSEDLPGGTDRNKPAVGVRSNRECVRRNCPTEQPETEMICAGTEAGITKKRFLLKDLFGTAGTKRDFPRPGRSEEGSREKRLEKR